MGRPLQEPPGVGAVVLVVDPGVRMCAELEVREDDRRERDGDHHPREEDELCTLGSNRELGLERS